MIKAVLLDLDDTLIHTNTAAFFPAYLQTLGDYASGIAPPDVFIQKVMASYTDTLGSYDATDRLYPRFIQRLASRLDYQGREQELEQLFAAFYADCYPVMRPMIRPRPESRLLLQWLYEHGYQVVVATNPAIPQSATLQRMAWGGIPSSDYPFALITSLENMHFGKPQPEYYEEILLRLDVNAGQAIVIGNDWNEDITAAAACGLNTYWVSENGSATPDGALPISGHGSYRRLIELVQSGWLDTLAPPTPTRQTLIHRLRAFPAEFDTLRRTYPDEVLECCPAENEWSARDIICHLCDHEACEDRVRLRRIAEEDNPFLSANYDPWAKAHEYCKIPVNAAFLEFARHRSETIEWLLKLPDEVWSRPARYAIFGPTHFEEMVRFTTEHDRTHLQQMRDAIAFGLQSCGSHAIAG